MGYTIEVRKDERLFLARLEGTWDVETMSRYELEMAAAFKQLKELGGPTRNFSDGRGFRAQSAATAERLAEIYRKISNYLPDRNAVVMDSTIAKLQVQRVIPDEKLRFFTDEETARAWLFGS